MFSNLPAFSSFLELFAALNFSLSAVQLINVVRQSSSFQNINNGNNQSTNKYQGFHSLLVEASSGYVKKIEDEIEEAKSLAKKYKKEVYGQKIEEYSDTFNKYRNYAATTSGFTMSCFLVAINCTFLLFLIGFFPNTQNIALTNNLKLIFNALNYSTFFCVLLFIGNDFLKLKGSKWRKRRVIKIQHFALYLTVISYCFFTSFVPVLHTFQHHISIGIGVVLLGVLCFIKDKEYYYPVLIITGLWLVSYLLFFRQLHCFYLPFVLTVFPLLVYLIRFSFCYLVLNQVMEKVRKQLAAIKEFDNDSFDGAMQDVSIVNEVKITTTTQTPTPTPTKNKSNNNKKNRNYKRRRNNNNQSPSNKGKG